MPLRLAILTISDAGSRGYTLSERALVPEETDRIYFGRVGRRGPERRHPHHRRQHAVELVRGEKTWH